MMNIKLIAFCACVAVVSAGLLPNAQETQNNEVDEHPNYSFRYDVQDAETGDFKSQSETRDGDIVQGQYTVHDADGYQRIVEYSVNGESGFNAVVRREPLPVPASEPIRTVSVTAAPAPPPSPSPAPAPTAAPAPIRTTVIPYRQQPQQTLLKTIAHPTAAYLAPTVLHHHTPAHTLIHAAPAVHLSPETHYVHAAPAAALLRTSPTVITTHHHAPTAHVVKTSFSSPHIKYVF